MKTTNSLCGSVCTAACFTQGTQREVSAKCIKEAHKTQCTNRKTMLFSLLLSSVPFARLPSVLVDARLSGVPLFWNNADTRK